MDNYSFMVEIILAKFVVDFLFVNTVNDRFCAFIIHGIEQNYEFARL